MIALDYRMRNALSWVTWVCDKTTASRAVAVLLPQGAEVIIRQPKDDATFWRAAYPAFN